MSRFATSISSLSNTSQRMNALSSAKLRSSPPDQWPIRSWTCPKTGLVVPKTAEANLRWRQQLRDKARASKDTQRALVAACAQSCLFWINAFAWTYRQRYVGRDGEYVLTSGHEAHYPLITWPVQDEAVEEVNACIDAGEDFNIDKARDMGASWLMLTVIDWRFLFRKEENFGVVSRKEALVDSRGDMDSLFEKLRYQHRMQPRWLLPPIRSRYMHLHNLEGNCTVAGESTNTDVGRGGRRTMYLVDEAAAIENGEEIENSLSQTTGCQGWISTPKGPNTQFHKRIKEKRGRYIIFPWWRHPEKAQGAHQIQDQLGRVRWTSPWYEKMVARMSPKAVAQEIDMDHGQAGDLFFDYPEIERHRRDYQQAHSVEGDLVFSDGASTEEDRVESIRRMDYDAFRFIRGHGRRRWRFWWELEDGRPPQDAQYVMGIDIANGSGGSNSIISVLDVLSGVYVAKFADAYTSPEELAVIACMAGVWFGGHSAPAFMVWENNGPGGIFGRKVVRMGYPRYYIQRNEGSRRDKRTDRYGWHSTNEKKELLLGLYRDALERDDVIQPCQQSLDEAGDYIYDDNGKLIPARLREETSGGRELHGDHVIGDALCVLGREEMPRQKNKEVRAPKGSFAHRRRLSQQQRDREQQAWAR